MAESCKCPMPNPDCRRAGVPMLGRLWELCSGQCPPERPCSGALSNQYRSLWDTQASGARPPATIEGPSLTEMGLNFANALLRFMANRGKTVDEGEYNRRVSICENCLPPDGYFDKENSRCLHRNCGCQVRGSLISKALWASEKCPVGKW